MEGGVDDHRSQRWTLAGLLCMTWAQPGTRAQEPVPQQWESSFCLGLDGKILAAVELSSRESTFKGEP